MASLLLERISMKRESKSFVDATYAILTAAGLFDGPKYRLSGLSGMAFKFTVHERLLPLSVSAYGQWIAEHEPAVDNLGLSTMADAGRTRHPSSPYYRREAVKAARESLDRGIGVIYWIPEFGVIYGYDDEDKVFYIQDGLSEEAHIVLYDFGINNTPFWYCRWFLDKVPVHPADMVLESLRLALTDWETPHKTLPDTDIASGRLGYSYFMNGLQHDDYDKRGALYILDSYLNSRMESLAIFARRGRRLGD